jgi:hypothetical protein
MQKPALTALVCLMFCTPFVLVALSYSALPSELPVLHLGIGHTILWAPKSLFMVFRVPVMNLIHGLMAAVMLHRAPAFAIVERRRSYANIFSTLLFTIAIKSDLEGLDFFAPASPALQPYEHWIAPATLTCVLAGLGVAMIVGRKVPLPWPELRLTVRDKIALSGLFATYLAIVVASISLGHRV